MEDQKQELHLKRLQSEINLLNGLVNTYSLLPSEEVESRSKCLLGIKLILDGFNFTNGQQSSN